MHSRVSTALDRTRLTEAADWFSVAVAVSLPWSTSATAILIVLWLIALVSTLDWQAVRREVMTPAGGLPVLLWAFAALGMLWADVDWRERIAGLGAFHKLLLIPLLLAQFRRSGRAHWVVIGFLASSLALLILSWSLALIPGLSWRGKQPGQPGVPFKDYIAQSGIFALCALGLLGQATELWQSQRRRQALLLTALAALFVANILYVATGRTTLVVLVVLLVIFGFRRFNLKGSLVVCLIGGVVAGVAWMSSSYMRARVMVLATEITQYREHGEPTPAGQRLEFWQKSLRFIGETPLIGHGTGTIETLFRRSAQTEAGTAGLITANPHNQVLAVAVQLGIAGAILLIAMWLAHLALFRACTPIAWIGFLVVAQNILGSLFNSHISDFTQGWIYVVGVGVLGSAMRSDRAVEPMTADKS